jgi:hypothetical protein
MAVLKPKTVEQAIRDIKISQKRILRNSRQPDPMKDSIFVTPTNELFLDLCERIVELERKARFCDRHSHHLL